MEKKISKKSKPGAINSVLIGISLLIFGIFGLVFVTQMEVQPGWTFSDLSGVYPVQFKVLGANDTDGDGYEDVFSYSDSKNADVRNTYNTPEFGCVYMLNSIDGSIIWNNDYTAPIKYAERIRDVNGDGIDDYFISKSTVLAEWGGDRGDEPQYVPNGYSNFLLSGNNGSIITLPYGIDNSFSNKSVMQIISLDDYDDENVDIICLEGNYSLSSSQYDYSLVGYFINGTRKGMRDMILEKDNEEGIGIPLPDIELFTYNGESHVLYVSTSNITLINRTSDNFSLNIYNKDYGFYYKGFTSVEDLNSDGNRELIIANFTGKGNIINGSNGNIIKEFDLHKSVTSDQTGDKFPIKEIPNPKNDGETYIVIDIGTSGPGGEDNSDTTDTGVYKITESGATKLWEYSIEERIENGAIVLSHDYNDDGMNDIIIFDEIRTTAGASSIGRYYILSGIDGNELGVINLGRIPQQIVIIQDIDGDGKDDLAFSSYDYVMGISTRIPLAIWQLPEFPLGIPFLILLIASLVAGIYLLLKNAKNIHFDTRKSLKENKLPIIVNVVAISLVTISFLMFLGLINVFNTTLLVGDPLSQVIIVFVLATVIWYGMLPLTAAIYNILAPRFAFLLVKMRVAFFKISKSNNNEILVLDLSERRELGSVNRIKRVILPMLLSIAIGFYVYNTFAPLLGYPKSFDQFGGTEFFQFIAGYNLLCTVPIIVTFALFSFLIAGNYLLDDAGVVYYLESKHYRKPGDIEPISIWSQSFIKGVAGFSALFTFGTFFASVDFSGFFQSEGMMAIFGIFMVVVMFWGQPFLTSFAYILLAVEIMDQSVDDNIKQLFEKMEAEGYDTTPHKLTMIYPEGYQPSKKGIEISSKKVKPDKKRDKAEDVLEEPKSEKTSDNTEPRNN